jgi:protease IV
MLRIGLCSLLLLLAGCGTPSFLITPVANTNVLQESMVQPGTRREKIAVIEVEGMLINMRSGGFLQPTENKLSLFIQQLETAEADPRVKAVVLRINSPGGTVTTSDTMYQAVLDFRRRTGRPVIASTQDVAASGGYYVACAADTIVAHPTSVIGSIGVVFTVIDIEGTMAKVGMRAETIKSGPLKDMGSPFHRLGEAERQVMQGMVDEYYGRFVAVLQANRPVSNPQTLEMVTSGQIFSGERAVELGLADRTGLLVDAIALARIAADAPRARAVMYRRPYGYTGSIYASQPGPPPETNSFSLDLTGSRAFLPTGFYYLWMP